MATPVWFVNLIKSFFPKRFLLAKMTNIPIIGKILDYAFFYEDYLVFLPGDHLVKIDVPVDEVEDIVLPFQVVEYFIKQANHHWIMDFCICRQGEDCQDYPKDYGCIFLGEAVLKINPKLGQLVTETEALDHAEKSRRSGLVHMIGRNKLDSVWLGTGPGEKLLTICNCCQCCCLWKIIPVVNPKIGRKVSKMPGVHIRVTDVCTGCGDCTQEICFVESIQIIDNRAVIDDSCKGCGRCADVCPNEAIELEISNNHFAQDTIDNLSSLVNVY